METKTAQPTIAKLPTDHPDCQVFFRYWDALEKDGWVPARTRFKPEDIPQLLDRFILVELISKDEVTTRLAGSAVIESFGFNPKGHNYLNYVEQSRRRIASWNLWTMHNHPCGIWALTEQRYPEGKTVQSEIFGLPFHGDDNSGPQILFLQLIIQHPRFLNREKTDYAVNHILDLEFIDIGAGVPEIPGGFPV